MALDGHAPSPDNTIYQDPGRDNEDGDSDDAEMK